jgi:Vacuolar H+-ATPase V1 sector, subunit H
MSQRGPMLPPSPVALAFPHIQWDPLGSLRLTAQETALLRMAETNPIGYTLADARDATMYARVLLKLLAEAAAAGAGFGAVSTISKPCDEKTALEALEEDPLGVVSHYAVTKLHSIITTLMSGTTVTVGNVFYSGKDGLLIDQWKALLRLLNKGGHGDLFAQSGAALCLALILVTACPSMQTAAKDDSAKTGSASYASAVEPLEALTAWIVSQLKSATGSNIGIAIPAMTALMAATETRHLFSASGGIKYLARQLRASSKRSTAGSDQNSRAGSATVQQLYELTFCLWCMTYELNGSPNIRADFVKDGAAVEALTLMVSTAPREKVVRVALAALVNLAQCTADEAPEPPGMTKVDGGVFLTDMLACKLLKYIQFLQDRQFTDPDIVEDIKTLHKLLSVNYKEMSRWEVYKTEVESGHLQWGSTHTEAFFKENARMLEGKDSDFKLLKVLIALLSSKDDEIAAIACHDIGEFVRFYPNGRAIAKRLGAKELVMPLIEHENVDLQRHALQCVSKMMVQHWEYVK